MKKYDTSLEYWVDPATGDPRYDFDAMYTDIDDPWGCNAAASGVANQVFADLIFHGPRRFGRILDVGCGLGAPLSALHGRNDGGYGLGLDVSETAVAKATERFPLLEFRQHNLVQGPLNERAFDLIVLSEVIWYIAPDFATFMSRIVDLLAPAGVLAVHQYFPEAQRFGRQHIDGLQGFLAALKAQTPLSPEHLFTSHQQDGLVLLATFRREPTNAGI